MNRQFEDKPAVRERTPLLVGLVGPSGTGKTYSALRLATGIQRVSGGDIFFIDSEARRGLHYADRFRFRHVPFAAPFGSLDYLAAVEHCVRKGAGVVVVDSLSHEHEGPGGMLESHAAEVERLSRGDEGKAERVKMLAWARPKADRRRLINTLLQLPCNFVFCFRAKEKLKIERGKDPVQLGWMPIAGEEFVYEMVMKCLLLPGANGVPSWQSEHPGERAMMKLPRQFHDIFREPHQLSEDIGQRLAEWAAGAPAARTGPVGPDELAALSERLRACDRPGLDSLKAEARDLYARADGPRREAIKALVSDAERRLTDLDAAQPDTLFQTGDATNLPG